MDLVGYRQEVFEGIETEYRDFLTQLNVVPERVVPVSAKYGDNIVTRSERMSWYRGPTVLETLGLFRKETARAERSEEHTSELQSRLHLVCRLLLEKKKPRPLICCRTRHC